MREMFITVEGIDGCGKSTQALVLKDRIEQSGLKVLLTKEPGGTPVGEAIRNILLNSNKEMAGATEFLLFASDRHEHVKIVITPSINNGIIVISDRYTDSSVAYQGAGRGVSIDFINYVHHFITEGLKPDLTFVVDVEPEVGLKRLKKMDRIENGGIEFLEKVRNSYLDLCKTDKRFILIDGNADVDIVSENIWQKFLDRRKEWVENQEE